MELLHRRPERPVTPESHWAAEPNSNSQWISPIISSSAFCWHWLLVLLSFFCWHYGHTGLGKGYVLNCVLKRCRRDVTSQLPLQQQRKEVQVELRSGQNQGSSKLLGSVDEINKIKIPGRSERWFQRKKVLRGVLWKSTKQPRERLFKSVWNVLFLTRFSGFLYFPCI